MADAGDLFGEGRGDESADDLEARLARTHLQATMFGGSKVVMVGHHRIVERIGAGGMGVVYRAVDERSGTTVALKTLPRVDAELLYRLKREFRTLCRIHHPNLVRLRELVVDEHRAFFTMQLIDGVAFDQYVRNDDPQRTRLRRALAGLVDGVEALHRAGIVHRDLKPSNALVDTSGHVYILDFGLATEPLEQRSGIRTSEGSLRGTLAYMAPEQVAGRPVDAAADWYAVGVMLYEALVGELPFSGSVLEVVAAKQSSDPPVAASARIDVPADLVGLAANLMQRDVGRRADREEARRVLGAKQDPTRRVCSEAEVFVGRSDELARLRELIEGARDGQPVVISVSGPSGIGKTRLVHETLQSLVLDETAVVLRGRCYEQESVAFKALDSIVDELSRRLRAMPTVDVNTLLPRDVRLLSRLFPVLERVEAVANFPGRDTEGGEPSELRTRAFRALKELLGRMTDRGSVIVFIDDLQWCDLDSVQLLEVLLTPPDPPRLVLLAAHRDEDMAPEPLRRARGLFNRVHEDGVYLEMVVPRLRKTEAIDMAVQLLPPGSLIDARTVSEEAEGNPFLLQALVRHCSQLPHAFDLSPGMVLENAIRALTPAARRLLAIVGVASRPVPAETALLAAGTNAAQLDDLISDGWLRRSPSGEGAVVETLHDRIRESVAAALSGDELADCHRSLAEVYETVRDVDPEDLARHWDLAGENERAVAHAEDAAERASEALAFGRAARLLRFVLDRIGDDNPAKKCGVAFALGTALEAAWQGPLAADAFLAAARGGGEMERIDCERRAAACLLASGHVERGLALARRVLEDVGITYHANPKHALASTLYWRARLRWRGARLGTPSIQPATARSRLKVDVSLSLADGLGFLDTMSRSASLSAQAAFRALDLGDGQQVARALLVEGVHEAISSPNRSRGLSLITRSEALSKQIGARRELAAAQVMRGVAAMCGGQWERAQAACQRGVRELRRHPGVLPDVVVGEAFRVWSLFYLGRWSEFARETEDVARSAERQQNLLSLWSMRAAFGPVRYLIEHDAESPARQLGHISAALPAHAFTLPHQWLILARGFLELYTEEYEMLYRRMDDAWPELRSSFILTIPIVRMQKLHLRAAAAIGIAGTDSGDKQRMWAEARRHAKQLLKLPILGADAHGLVILAAVEHQRGNEARAVRRLEDAELRFRDADMKVHAAISRLRRAQLLGTKAETLAAEACAVLTAEGGQRPGLLANLVAPGFRAT